MPDFCWSQFNVGTGSLVKALALALAEQARLARIQSAQNHRDLRRQTTRALRRNRSAYWKAIAEETEREAACGDTRKATSQIKPESFVDGESTLGSFSITQHPRTLYLHHRIPQRRKTTLVTLTRPLWTRGALPSDSYAVTELLEMMASQRRFIRRASSP